MSNTLNKLQHTKVGDNINFYVNGVSMDGIVTGISGTYITVVKDNKSKTINIDDTFFVKDIIVKNKTWNDMSSEERTEILYQVKAYSPRFIGKTWEQLPRELRDVIKSGVEQGSYGNAGSRPFVGVSTQMEIDAPKDYEGATHNDFKEQFKHEKQKPKVTMEGHSEAKKDGLTSDGVNAVYSEKEKKKIEKAIEDTRPTFGIKYLTKAQTEEFMAKQKKDQNAQ